METKTCGKCNKDKLLNQFYKDKRTKTGLSCWCKECKKIYYKENKLKRRIYQDEYYSVNKNDLLKKLKNKYENKESYEKQSLKKSNKSKVDNLSDYYLKEKLKRNGYSKEDITPQLMETKKLIIAIKRELNNR